MHFAVALPWWGYVAAFTAAVLCAWLAYARLAMPISRRERILFVTLRACALLLLVVCILRPVRLVHGSAARDSVVAILVDTSRSMRLANGDGQLRIEQARTLVTELQARLATEFQIEVFSFGETVARTAVDQLAADARRSDLSGALRAVHARGSAQPLAGIIVVSDGGDTAAHEAGADARTTIPVFTLGVGEAEVTRDREVVLLTAGEPALADSSVDLSVAVSSRGFGRAPLELRLSEDGRPIESRRLQPESDGAPIHEVFTVLPAPDRATIYAVEVAAQAGELAVENNVRRVLVPPHGRRRKVLLVEGAPGFEHTFLKRALAKDSALEIDSVVRKGQNNEGRDTFFIQVANSRASTLASGYPTRRADLFAYDAVFVGNLEADFFTAAQLEMTADFVAQRGGGLLMFGARSFEGQAFAGTALEPVLPLDTRDRTPAVARTAAAPASPQAPTLTGDGERHPATRLAASVEDGRRRWAQLPPLASVTPTGAPRPGAQVLAVTGGAQRTPLIVAQRYGAGRSLIFAGEASWRWRMLLPASDSSYEHIWRQLARWVAGGSTSRIELAPSAGASPGMTESIVVLVRDEEFRPVVNAEVVVRVLDPTGQERSLSAPLVDPQEGRYAAAARFDQTGVHTIAADVRRGGEVLGTLRTPMLVGGVDVELAEPRLNEAVLRRIAATSGGRYLPAAEWESLFAQLRDSKVGAPPREVRDLWHTGWTVGLIVAVLGLEWMLRRRVGLS